MGVQVQLSKAHRLGRQDCWCESRLDELLAVSKKLALSWMNVNNLMHLWRECCESDWRMKHTDLHRLLLILSKF